MSQASQQSTFTDVAIAARKRALYWTPDNPAQGAPAPDLHEGTIRRYHEDPDSLPYEVPTTGGVEQGARNKHRTWFWLENPFSEYVCPDCDRPMSEVKAADVHHIDENPRNGAPENLVGLCRYCHKQRHGKGGTRGRPLALWKREFPADVGGGRP